MVLVVVLAIVLVVFGMYSIVTADSDLDRIVGGVSVALGLIYLIALAFKVGLA